MKVEVIGWEVGYNGIEMTNLIKEVTGCGLVAARSLALKIMDNEIVVVDVENMKDASEFINRAKTNGAQCRLVS